MTWHTWHDVMPSMPGAWHDVAFMSFYMALMPSDVALMLMLSEVKGPGHEKWENSMSLLEELSPHLCFHEFFFFSRLLHTSQVPAHF